MTTATSIDNHGVRGGNLTKPAGVKTASIVPDKTHSVYIPTQATFQTGFSADEPIKSFWLYTKPNPGVVMNVHGHDIVYTGHSYTINNDVGDIEEISADPAAGFIVVVVGDAETTLFVNDEFVTIDGNTFSSSGPLTVTLLSAGGILDYVCAAPYALSNPEIGETVERFLNHINLVDECLYLYDEDRNAVDGQSIPNVVFDGPGVTEFSVAGSEVVGMKLNYEATGDISVFVDGEPYAVGGLIDGESAIVTVASESGGAMRDIVLVKYNSEEVGVTGSASVLIDGVTGIGHPMHRQSDLAAYGEITIVLDEPVPAISGWFKNEPGSPLPGVEMDSNKNLTGTGIYVNGEPYSGGVVEGWYFLTKVSSFSGGFSTTIPAAGLIAHEVAPSAEEVSNLYQSFVGNIKFEIPKESVSAGERESTIVSTEWDIVGSG